jgi:nitric oxide reductase NorD protein
VTRRWFGVRRLALKTQYAAQRARARLRQLLRTGPATMPLAQVQRRLELVLTAVYGRPIPIAPIANTFWNRERIRRLSVADIYGTEATPSVDGETIFLPLELATRGDAAQTAARYRLFAIEQAERIARGTATLAPHADPLERDLYLLRESATIDAHIARAHPGVLRALSDERRQALATRPALDSLTPVERDVELLIRESLSTDPHDPVAAAAVAAVPADSLAWARATARRIRRRGVAYRGLPASALWGTVKAGPTTPRTPDTSQMPDWMSPPAGGDTHARETPEGLMSEGGGHAARLGVSAESAPHEGESEVRGGHVKNELEAWRKPDPSRSPDGAVGRVAGVLGPNDHEGILDDLPAPVFFDEWNRDARAYVKRGASVRVYKSTEGDDAWARETLASHGAIVRQIRQEFERLRARRTLLSRQRSGDDLDIAACVNAMVDRRIGRAPDDRLYLDARPARRGLAIALLVDASGSTESRVTSDWRIIDLEKIALLLASQALDALGDLYAVYAFAGKSASNVKVTTIKEFPEHNGETVDRRIDALQPGGFTRLGAAVRYATHSLARQSAGHRLLLLLSDGRPNDVDIYQGPYGVEDSRQAIFEARASGVYPFCLTIDRDASEYLPRIFGEAGHTILQNPRQLPTALLGVVRALIRRP